MARAAIRRAQNEPCLQSQLSSQRHRNVGVLPRKVANEAGSPAATHLVVAQILAPIFIRAFVSSADKRVSLVCRIHQWAADCRSVMPLERSLRHHPRISLSRTQLCAPVCYRRSVWRQRICFIPVFLRLTSPRRWRYDLREDWSRGYNVVRKKVGHRSRNKRWRQRIWRTRAWPGGERPFRPTAVARKGETRGKGDRRICGVEAIILRSRSR